MWLKVRIDMQFSSVLLLFGYLFPAIFGIFEDQTYYPISNWTQCDENCRTYRKLICLKFAECGINIIKEDAYCYERNSKNTKRCKKYIINQINKPSAAYKSPKKEAHKRYAMPSKLKCERSQNTPTSLKILGGTLSKRSKWPWHVALMNDSKGVYCAGTLITPRWVLTAAHCIRNTMYVRLNEYDLYVPDQGEEEVHISRDRIHIHPLFNQHTVDSDIALLKLPRLFHLPVACLPNAKPKPNRLCSVMGWGKVNMKNQHGTRFLREAQISIMTQKKCKYSYREFFLTRNMFCAGVSSGKFDTCGGDSGGGLMCPKIGFPKNKRDMRKIYYSVDGITSFGDGCGIKEKYGIYTLVHNFVPWIKRTIYNNT